jgi:hypothetical protein
VDDALAWFTSMAPTEAGRAASNVVSVTSED